MSWQEALLPRGRESKAAPSRPKGKTAGQEGGPGRGGPQTVLWWGHGMNDFLSRPAREPLSISLLFCASWLVDG